MSTCTLQNIISILYRFQLFTQNTFVFRMDFVLIERTKKEIEDFSNAHDDISPSMTLRSKRVFVCSEENENMKQRYNIFVEYVVISTSAEIDVHVIPWHKMRERTSNLRARDVLNFGVRPNFFISSVKDRFLLHIISCGSELPYWNPITIRWSFCCEKRCTC